MGDDSVSASVTLAAVVRAAQLTSPPASVLQKLRDDHAITSIQDLRQVLAHDSAARALPALWRVRLEEAVKTLRTVAPADSRSPAALQWRPNGDGTRLRIVVMQGDLTQCTTDAIVNAANGRLSHDGGLAGAIAERGGRAITLESNAWIREHKSLSVGRAMVTSGGALPCRFVIHTVGPRVGTDKPTAAQAKQLRQSVGSALCEAEKLALKSIAIPGISSGIFGYPRDLAAREILSECARFCRARSKTTTLETIVLMSNDSPTCKSFVKAIQDAARDAMKRYDGAPVLRATSPTRLPVPGSSASLALPPHKASGVMVTRVGASDFEVLVGVEFRLLDTKPGRYINFLGGKVDHGATGDDETPMATACREFSEEVAGLLTANQVNRAMEQSSRSVYIEFAKYTLFAVHLDTKRTRSLPDLYEKKVRRGAEHDHLVWVPWRELVAAAGTSATKPVTNQSSFTDRGLIHTSFGAFRVSDLVQKTIASFGLRIESQLEQLMLKEIVSSEIERVKSLKSTSDQELIDALLGLDWKLRLTSPPMLPPAPIELLKPSDVDYKQVVSELDDGMASRVVSVRRVRVSARAGQYQQHRSLVEAIPGGKCTEVEPLFHGTPERWRATAIAMNGFDLSILLCGRSLGNGVYTSTQIAIAQGYTGQSGSLVRLRGRVVAAPNNSAENTISRAPVYVFPNPKALLPLAIVDYAAADESDSIAEQQKLAQDEYVRLLAQRRAMKKSMVNKEKAFEQATGNRLRAALNVYSARLAVCQESMNESSGATTTAMGRPSTSRQLFLERNHFTMSLPIYEVKPQLVKLLQINAVLIVIAETGSGKSTQLPQILLDDVLPSTETRRIAILQPRRVNAISLCKRVSEERGCVSGSEVGYTIGRGESTVTPRLARLEFMTHGLFVQLARDYNQLMNKYCAVIVDEAHERSVDVDLSLALLKRALHRLSQAGKGTGKSFQVIVTSATIGKEAQHFQRYLDPSLNRSSIFRVQGRAFPVHVEYRSDVQVQRDAVGTAGVGKVLTSYAIQTAIDLLRSTETGNILIFLPGEGSISDALEVSRNDIATSATVEALDVFGSESKAFCFRMSEGASTDEEQKESERGRVVTTCVVGFHGKITRAERDHVLNPRSDGWRLVVFTTNVAETGVTIPNVRYVIDTGLERRVRWNAALDLNEMVTEPVSASSMTQRTGRAGRTASGICVRLFSEESVGDQIQPDVTPGVQNSMIYKAVLLDKQLEGNGESGLELLDPIDPDLMAQAQERLVELGALDRTNGKLTKEGAALLRIGVDLRLGRFLIACARFGCLATGVKLASLLVAADAPERLLPDRRKPLLATQWEGLVDPSGDHITLLNIIEAYENAERKGEEIQWCQERSFELDVFSDAEASREYLLKVLDTLHFPLADDDKAIETAGGKHVCIRLALCAAYHDQLARPRMAATANNGFIRVLDESTSEAMRQNAADFADRTQARRHPHDENDSDLSSDDGDTSDIRSQASSEPDEEPIVKLASRSTLWLDDVTPTLAATADGLVVFGSLMLTDGATRGEPTVQLVSCVTAEEVKAGAPQWCQLINFDQLMAATARETREYKLAPGMNQTILMDRGSWLTQLKNMFKSAVVATIKNGKLLVTCPRRSLARIEHHVEKQLRAMEPESVVLQLPATVNMGKIIGKGGQQVKALEAGLQEFLSSEHRGAGRYHIQRQQVLKVDSGSKTIQVTLQGASKPLMGVVVGRVQSAIVELHGNEMLPLVLDASGECGQQMQQHPRLAQLLNRVAPTSWATRDDAMLQLAHMLVWTCGVSIYGGFLRDWVVRGEAANDIDVQLAPPQTTTESVERLLDQFLAESSHANAMRLRITDRAMKGAAYTLTIEGNGIEKIDVDLVDPARVHKVIAPPGVDCDAGNLLLNRTESLRKKVPAAGDSLSEALENSRQKRFVFFYPLGRGPHQDMSVKRLKKYLGRGWTCLSPVPRAVQREFLTPEERQLIRPRTQTN